MKLIAPDILRLLLAGWGSSLSDRQSQHRSHDLRWLPGVSGLIRPYQTGHQNDTDYSSGGSDKV